MKHTTTVSHPYQESTGKNSHSKRTPHLRLTVEEIKQRREFMRCDQYLADLLAAMKAVGWKFVIHDIPKFAESIGLGMRTFQRARKMLIDAGKLIETHINRDSIEFFLVRDYDKPIALDDKPIALDDKPIALDDTPIALAPPEPALQADLGTSSDLLSDPLSDPLSPPPPTHEERENLEIFENGKPVPEFKSWLEAQAKKMPKAIANIPVWIASMAKRDEWQAAFMEWREAQSSAVPIPLSPSTNYEFSPSRSTAEISEIKAAIEAAKSSLKISVPAKKTHLQ
jgi:hypothetical protein